MIKKESYCSGCDHCIDCGRKETLIICCDSCGSSYGKLYRMNGNYDYCYDCLKEQILKESINEIYNDFFEEILDMYEIEEVKND